MGIKSPEQGMSLPVTYYTLKMDDSYDELTKEFRLSGWYRDYSGGRCWICFRQLSGDYRSEADGLHAGLAEDNLEESAVFRVRHRQNAAGNKYRQQADHQRRL